MFSKRLNDASLVGGVVADVFAADTRGVPMSIFAFLILSGQGVGAVIYGKSKFKSLLDSPLIKIKPGGWI